jgi:hypothetical protein
MKGIATVLKDLTFLVPIYQRSYAWTDGAVEDFWEDLKHAIDAGEPDYFLGTLVLTPDEDSGRTTIIDGQQRLATTSLLLAALRNVYHARDEDALADEVQKDYLSWLDRRSKEREPRLLLNAEDDPFFRELVVEEGKPPTPSRESHERLAAAYKNLQARLEADLADHGRRGDKRLLDWADYLDKQASVITVTVPTVADAFVIFETLNDRGARLTLGDLLKNYLFMKAEAKLETVKTSWLQALAAMDLSAEDDVFITFLRHHWSSKEGAVRERELYGKIKESVASSAQAAKYAKELADAAKLYRAITEPGDDHWGKSGFGKSARTNVQTLLDLELEQNRPLLLAVMQHFTVAEQKRTLRALVSWSVRGLVVGGIGGGQSERVYCDAAVKVRSGHVKTKDELQVELKTIVPDDGDFEDEFSRARQTKPKIARYIQLTLERAQCGKSEPELVPNDDAEQVDLEHILPRNAKASDWPAFPPEDVSTWANRLGNHTLLKKTQNNKIGNKAWAVKKPILAKSSLALTKKTAQMQDWDKGAIGARQKMLAKLAVKAWPR